MPFLGETISQVSVVENERVRWFLASKRGHGISSEDHFRSRGCTADAIPGIAQPHSILRATMANPSKAREVKTDGKPRFGGAPPQISGLHL